MARGSASNVTESRTRSKRGTPTKEIEEKQATDSTDKKTVATRRKNNNLLASKVEKKVNKKLKTDNSGETSSSSNKNEELELVGKKVFKKNQQNKVTKPVGRKRKVENTVDEVTEEAVGEVEIVKKRSVKGQNKKLKTDTMDESSQDSIKEAISGSTKKTKNVEENIIEKHNDEDKDLEGNIKDAEVEAKIVNIEKKDLSATLDDSSQGSIKINTMRKTRSSKKVEGIIIAEEKDVCSDENKSTNENDAKVDIVDDTSPDSMKVIKSSPARKTRNSKKIDEVIIVEQKDTNTVEADENINSEEISVKGDMVDENSQDSIKVSKSIPTRKTRSAKKVEETGVELSDEDKDLEQKDIEKIKIDDLVVKDKTDIVDNNDKESTTLIKSGTSKKTRSVKNVEEIISVEHTDAKVMEVKLNIGIKNDMNDDTSRDSLKITKGGSTRTTRSAKKAEVDIQEDNSLDSIKSNQSGPTRNVKNVKENIAQDDEVVEEISSKKVEGMEQDEKEIESDNVDDSTQNNLELVKDSDMEIENTKDIEENILVEHKVEDLEQKECMNMKSGEKLDSNEEELKSEENEDPPKDFEHMDSKDSELEAKMDQRKKDAETDIVGKKKEVGVVKNEVEPKNCNDESENTILREIEENKLEVQDTFENFDKNIENCEKVAERDASERIEEDNDESFKIEKDISLMDEDNDESSKIEKDISLMDETTLLKNVEEKVSVNEENILNPEAFDEDNQSISVLEDDQLSNVVTIVNEETIQTDASGENKKLDDEDPSEDTSIQEPENIVGNLESIPGKIDFSEDTRKSKDNESFIGEVLSSEIKYSEDANIGQINTGKESDIKCLGSEIDDQSIVLQSNFEISGLNSTVELDTSADKSTYQEQSNLNMEDECLSDKILSVKEMCSVEECEDNTKENVKTVDVTADFEIIGKFSEELEQQDIKVCQSGIEEIPVKNPRLDISENIDQEYSTTSMIDETSEKTKVDIDACSDKTEVASVANLESESSTTDSDTGNLVIADNVESINTEKEISGCEIRTEEISTANISESPIKNITGDDTRDPMTLEVDTMKNVSLTLNNVEMPSSTVHTSNDGTDNALNEDANNISASPDEHCSVKSSKKNSNYLAGTDKELSDNSKENEIVATKSNIIDSFVSICEDATDVEQKTNYSVIKDETVDGEPKMSLDIKSSAKQISKEMPLLISNEASSSKDKNEASIHCQMAEGSSSSPDKIVGESSHGESNFDTGEKQKVSKKKKSTKSAKKEGKSNKTSIDPEEVERNEAGKRIITTYEVSSNVDGKKGVKRNSNVANEGEGSGTEVSFALKIKRKRIEEVESHDAGPSIFGEHGTPAVSNETNLNEQTQQPSAEYQSEPGPSGIQQESKRSTRKRKREESDQQSRENSAAPIRMYLEKFVPFLLEGLLKITYVRPEDPIQYLADWMKENKEAAYSSMNNDDISSDE